MRSKQAQLQQPNLILHVFKEVLQHEVFQSSQEADPSAFSEILTIVSAIITSCLSKDDLLQILKKFLEVFAQPLKAMRE